MHQPDNNKFFDKLKQKIVVEFRHFRQYVMMALVLVPLSLSCRGSGIGLAGASGNRELPLDTREVTTSAVS